MLRRLRFVLLVLVVAAAVVAAGGAAFVWSGVYNVGASVGHWPISAWALHLIMRRSVAFHAAGLTMPPPTDANDAIRGAGHFYAVCASCHGGPGQPRSPVNAATTPAAPSLAGEVNDFTPNELFWVVKHGIKYTAMPAWPAQQRDDEVAAAVAFLRQLPTLTPKAYEAMALGEAADLRLPPDVPAAARTCIRCHGSDGNGRGGIFPALSGQAADYLKASLLAYRDGSRPSGIMQAEAAGLRDADIDLLAAYFAGLPRPAASLVATPAAPENNAAAPVISCFSCHDPDPAKRVNGAPLLGGEPAWYIAQQLRLFKAGVRRGGQSDMMRPIAEALGEDAIAAIATYLQAGH